MIFISKNEDGEPAWQLILDGRKTVTRRLKPVSVGKVLAVQPGRGKHAVCHIKVKSCENSFEHFRRASDPFFALEPWKDHEAALEGFRSWMGLQCWLEEYGIKFWKTFRIEFELVKERVVA